MSRIIFDNNEFERIDAGGNGDCFFKCIAQKINSRAGTVRANVVTHVVENWTSFETYAKNILGVNSKNDYKVEMGKSGTHASLIECKAAADRYLAKFFAREKDRNNPIKFRNIIEKTAECLEISPSTVQQSLQIAPKSGRPAIPFDIFLQGMIRQTIHGFYAEKMYPSLEMVHKKLQECEHIPDFKLTTLKTWCKKLNFSYKKFNKKPVWMENVSVAAQRDTYLRQIAHYRENGYNIFYTDESWCDANHSRKYGWIETIQSSEINNFDSDRCRWLVNRPVPLPQNINEFADLTKNELLQLAKLKFDSRKFHNSHKSKVDAYILTLKKPLLNYFDLKS
ncbi:Protein of unknown function [Cotesia congregata]|uniref:OTU domain-containing protein n=1 Tax=Cotesia congregata TaxID=51543 RepID=A0A8J2HIF3_COTCN|nr:Protein of unknown function [Cotesia congregata]